MEVIATAIYFSDHGENVYDENDNVGHDYADVLQKRMWKFHYCLSTARYQSLYPNKLNIIYSNKNKPFITDNLFHAIIDINDITFKLFEPERSIFNKKYNSNRKRI